MFYCPRFFLQFCITQLIFLVFVLPVAALAQEVPGKVHFKTPPKQEPAALPQTPFRKPDKTLLKTPEDVAKEAEKPQRRPPASERRSLPVPEELQQEDAPRLPQPPPPGNPAEQKRPTRLIDSVNAAFSVTDIALYRWREVEKYFDEDPAQIWFLKARVFHGEQVVPPDSLNRNPLPEGFALLTIFPREKQAEIPLAQQYFSQDILFLDEEGIIREMVYRTEPRAEKTVISEFPARSVLQLKSGSIQAWGLKIGDKLAIPPR